MVDAISGSVGHLAQASQEVNKTTVKVSKNGPEDEQVKGTEAAEVIKNEGSILDTIA